MNIKDLIDGKDNNTKNSEALKVFDNEEENLLKREDFNYVENQNELIEHQKKVILTKHLKDIQSCDEKIKIFQTIGYISVSLFSLMFMLKYFFYYTKNFKFFYFLIPSILAIISFDISMNYYLKLKKLVEKDEQEILNDNHNNSNLVKHSNGKILNIAIGNCLTYFTINFIALLICLFLVLLTLKLEQKLFIKLSILFIPLYVALGFIILYFIFIFPAFISHKYFWELVLFSSYLANSIVLIILLSMKIDNKASYSYFHIFIPVLIAVGLHLIYSIYQVFFGEDKLIFRILFLISITILYAALIYLAVILQNNEYKQLIKDFILFILSIIIYSIERIANFYIPLTEETNEKE